MKLDMKGHGWKLRKPLTHVVKFFFFFRSGLNNSFPVSSLKIATNDFGEGTQHEICMEYSNILICPYLILKSSFENASLNSFAKKPQEII